MLCIHLTYLWPPGLLVTAKHGGSRATWGHRIGSEAHYVYNTALHSGKCASIPEILPSRTVTNAPKRAFPHRFTVPNGQAIRYYFCNRHIGPVRQGEQVAQGGKQARDSRHNKGSKRLSWDYFFTS